MTRLAWLFAVGMLLGCPPVPATPPPDAADSAPRPSAPDATVIDCLTACAAMDRAGCVVLSDCTRVLCATNADPRFAHYDLTCLAHALTTSDVRACGADCTVKP